MLLSSWRHQPPRTPARPLAQVVGITRNRWSLSTGTTGLFAPESVVFFRRNPQLTDRDPAFCVGQTSDGRAILALEWVDLCSVLGLVPKACRPYRAQTKGKVERMVRELKEGFLPWLTGQVMPQQPTLADYDRFAQRWVEEVVCRRRHRTTGKVVEEAWEEERGLLRPVPARILAGMETPSLTVLSTKGLDPEQRRVGERVEVRDLAVYEEALG